MPKNNLIEKLRNVGVRVIKSHDIELVDVELVKEMGNWYLRYYIDKPGGVTIDDCQKISEQLSNRLDIEDPIPYSYILEVSSPGIERPLKNKTDFDRAIDSLVEIKTYEPIDNQKAFVGILRNYADGYAFIEEGDNKIKIPTEKISSAKTKFTWKGE